VVDLDIWSIWLTKKRRSNDAVHKHEVAGSSDSIVAIAEMGTTTDISETRFGLRNPAVVADHKVWDYFRLSRISRRLPDLGWEGALCIQSGSFELVPNTISTCLSHQTVTALADRALPNTQHSSSFPLRRTG